MTSSRIVGPAVGGLLIANTGVGWCFVLNAVSYLAVLGALAAMRAEEVRATEPVPRERGQVRAGLRYVWSTPRLRLPLVLTAVISTIAFNYAVVLPILSKDTFAGDAGTYTVLFSVMSAGSLVGALAAAARRSTGPRFMVGSAAAFGVTTVLASLAPSLPLTAVALVPVGLTGIAFMSSATAELQLNAEPSMRGRVLALHAVVFLGSTPLGGPVIGWVTEAFGPRVGLGIGGIAAIAAVAGAVRSRRDHPLADLADEWHAYRARVAA
jgi:MFS family permease